MGPPFDDDFGDEEEDTQLTDLPNLPTEEVAAEDVVEVIEQEITKPHDAGEWLAGFKAGNRGLHADYDKAVRLWARAFGFTDDKADEIAQGISQLALGPRKDKK